jgi:hypothetical protein
MTGGNPGRARRLGTACLLGALIFLPGGAGHAQTTGSAAASPALIPAEDALKFPQWAHDLRRGEIIALGSFPFTYFFASIAVDLYRFSQHGGDFRYAPWLFKSAGAVDMTTDEQILTIAAAAGGAILVSLADFIILQIKRNSAARTEAALPPGDPIIIRKPWPPEEELREAPEP